MRSSAQYFLYLVFAHYFKPPLETGNTDTLPFRNYIWSTHYTCFVFLGFLLCKAVPFRSLLRLSRSLVSLSGNAPLPRPPQHLQVRNDDLDWNKDDESCYYWGWCSQAGFPVKSFLVSRMRKINFFLVFLKPLPLLCPANSVFFVTAPPKMICDQTFKFRRICVSRRGIFVCAYVSSCYLYMVCRR